MDPLSISVSIIAILQASNAVLSFCYDYRAGVKSSPWQLTRVVEEVKSLRTVVETLESLTLAASEGNNANETTVSRLPTLHLLCKANGDKGALLDLCLEELKAIERKLTPPGWAGPAGSKRLAAVRALGWPFQESDLTKRLETIGRFRDTLNLAITADQTALVLKIEEVVQAIRDKTLGVQDELGRLSESINRVKIDDHRQKIHDWLAAPDPSSNHVNALEKRQAATGSWFIGGRKFADWKTSPNSFLWLHGIPGCGKTILASTIIEEVRTHCELNLSLGTAPNPPPTCAVVYFYFDFSSQGKKQNQEKMIRSLIKQLSERLPSASEPLGSLFSSCTNGNHPPTTKALRTCLGQIIGEFNHVFIILDALDECADKEGLMDSIQEIVTWDLEMLHVLVTSQKEREIEDRLDLTLTDEQKVHIQSDLIERDIHTYIYAQLRTDKKLKKWPNDDLQMIEQTLMEKADGMFRLVACQLDALKECIQRRQLRLALASLPETLDDTYANILCDIKKDRSKDALKILQWLAYSARPLRIEEVAEVIAVNTKSKPRIDPDLILREPRDILTICSSLVTTYTDTTWNFSEKRVGEQIRLAHLSVRDYLTSEQILAGKAAHYSIRQTHAHEAIAETCLAYLLRFDKPDALLRLTANGYPLAQYAAEYWPHHVRASGNETDQIVLLIMELFSNQDTFSNWLRFFDPDKVSPEVDDLVLPDLAEPLYYASQVGLVGPIKLLLKKGAHVNAGGKLYRRALQAASAGGYYQTVKLLLDEGADVNEQIGAHDTALQVASVEGHNTVVETLLKGGAKVNIQGGLYGNSLQGASAVGHDEVVRTLINAGAVINAEGGDYGTALLAASFGGYDKIVKRLLEAGASIELPDACGRRALQHAASQGYKSTVHLLIEEGADVNAEDYDGWAALDEAAPAGFGEIVQVLLDAGSKADAPDHHGCTALHFTAAQGHTAIVQLLLQKGADANFYADEKESSPTPLLEAAMAGHDATAKTLIDGGALVNTANRNRWTPLHAATMTANIPMVRVLLENGAKLTADADGWTPLHIAVLKGNKPIVELLLENGAEIDAKDAEGKTPMEWAALCGTDVRDLERKAKSRGKSRFTLTGLRIAAAQGDNLKIRQQLKNGADINVREDGGMTALMWAAISGHRSTMILLIENGADVNLKRENGNTIRDYLEEWEDEVVIGLLEKKFNYQAEEDERQLTAQRRQDVLRLLEDWEAMGHGAKSP